MQTKNKIIKKYPLKNKSITSITAVIILSLCSGIFPTANFYAEDKYTVGNMEQDINAIISWKQKSLNVSSAEELINKGLSINAGTGSPEWYFISLKRYKTDNLSDKDYISALNGYVEKSGNNSAVDLQRIALSYAAAGENRAFIDKTIANETGKLGIMSNLYGLILMDAAQYKDSGNSTNSTITRDNTIGNILSAHLADGGWALTGSTSDIDITAMAIQALAPYYNVKNNVKPVIDGALTMLSKRQLATGDYQSWGVRNAESVSQVIMALCSLNIDCQKDSRFIKNGINLIGGLMYFKLQDGSFCHDLSNKISNDKTCTQALSALVALWRLGNGLSSYYNFSNTASTAVTSPVNSNTGQTGSAGKTSGTAQKGSTAYKAGTTQAAGTAQANSPTQTGGTGQTNNIDQTGGTGQAGGTAQNDSTARNDGTVQPGGTAQPDNTAQPGTTERPSGTGQTNNSSHTNGSGQPGDSTGNKTNYKIYIYIAIILIAIICALFIVIKKKKIFFKNIISILVIMSVALLGVYLVNIQTVEEHDSEHTAGVTAGTGISSGSETVFISINCKTAADVIYSPDGGNLSGSSAESLKKYIPQSGVIIDKKEFALRDGDSVFDILKRAAGDNKIQMEYTGDPVNPLNPAYIKGIDYLYQYSLGALSGWLYKVNGEFISKSCSDYKLKNGDTIEWVYTCDLRKDVGDTYIE